MLKPESRILIVDDTMTARMMIKLNLKQLGYEDVHEAKGGWEAWKEIQKADAENKTYDLIICDWMMPEGDGIELVKNIRSHAQFKKTLILMITAESEYKSLMDAVSMGINAFLIKPVTAEFLSEKIKNL